jgi:Cu+-exporting ATPase
VTFAFAWTPDRIAAILLGGGALAFLWVFFFGGRKRREQRALRSAIAAAGDEVTIRVAGGYDPEIVVARPGVPLTLIFDRRESNPCTDEIVIPDFGVRQSLVSNGKTRIRIVPKHEGEYPFSCGMNMLHGKIRVAAEG